MSVEVLQAFEKPLLHTSVLQQQHHRCQLAVSEAASVIRPMPREVEQQQWQQQQQQQAVSQLSTDPDSSQAIENRKLVVLGLPWETDEETLQQYFSQYGALEEALIMKDRSTGKSRGFGFVTYLHPGDAQRVSLADHQVNGRRCEAKFALPRGGSAPNRTTRLFVARIPGAVSDQQFRSYFEQFGIVQDAYMPKDAFKQGHRGIGFVTYATVEPVEQIMASAHTLNGQELAIDRATPKEKPGLGQSQSNKRLTLQQQLANNLSPTHSLSHSGYSTGGTPFGGAYDSISGASLAQHGSPRDTHSPTDSNATSGQAGNVPNISYSSAGLTPDLLMSLQGLAGLDMHGNGSNTAVYQAMQGLPGYRGSENGIGIGLGLQHLAQARAQAQLNAQQAALVGNGLLTSHLNGLHAAYLPGNTSTTEGDSGMTGLSSGYLSNWLGPGSPPESVPQSPGVMALQDRQLMANDGPASSQGSCARDAGPRIFVGKLVRGTTESDVRDYFSKFGYVMDVYMPRDRVNRAEHRGFGFVTFETEAAIIRVASYGGHMIRGSVVAIDCAVPRRDQDGNRILVDEMSMLKRRGVNPGLDPAIVLELGPDRHHATDRMKHGYRPY